MTEYIFTKITEIDSAKTTYVLNWFGGNANGTYIENLVEHLKVKQTKINLREDELKGCEKILEDGRLRSPPSDRDFQRFYSIGKSEGVII